MLVTADWLNEHLEDQQVVIIDCRFDLTNPEAGWSQYQQGHIPTAIYLDLEKDLAGPVQEHGGRHPLPDIQEFVEKMGSYGVDEKKHVIVYDNQSGAMAARCWFLLTYLGHPQVSLLEGGYDHWVQQGYPISDERPIPEKTKFVPHLQPSMVASMNDVKEAIGEGAILIDSRAPERYQGKEEPLDIKAGHIPGAENHFWKRNLAEGQYWKSVEQLQADWADTLKGAEKPILYCGSGVTACVNLFALYRVGIRQAKLYPGSWSDWISYPDNPIVREE